MKFRFPLAVALAALGTAAVIHAQGGQTPPVPHVRVEAQQAAEKENPKPYELPDISPNLKWSTIQNSAQLLLMLDKHVQDDLGLSADTRQGIVKVTGEFSEKYTALTKEDASKSDLEAQLDTITLDAANKVVALLSPTEQVRLKQLGVQAMGFNAFRLADLRLAMSLIPSQVKELDQDFVSLDTAQTALEDELGQQLSQVKDPGPQGTADERAAFQKAQQAIVSALTPRERTIEADRKNDFATFLKGLSAAQEATWKTKVHGHPVKGSAPTS